MGAENFQMQWQGPQKAFQYLNSVLVEGEKIEAAAIQRRIFALIRRREMVAATSGRLIYMTRGLLGGFRLYTIRWQDIRLVDIQQGILGATLTVTGSAAFDLASNSDGSPITIIVAGMRKAQTQAVYRISQGQDQAWREKRRQRELEQMRAKSGGFQMGAQAGTQAGAERVSGTESPAERLQKAKALLEQGLINDSEFETIKARIINQF